MLPIPVNKSIGFNFNKIYKPVFTTDCRYIDIWGGRGRGGSHFGTDYFLFLITQPRYFRGYFVRAVYGDIRESLFRDFKDRIDENPDLDIKDFYINDHEMRVIYKPTGNMILSKGIKAEDKRTAKMKSLAGATHVLLEEADEVGEMEFDQLDLSLRTTKAEKVQILRIFNPPGRTHWLWRDYILTESRLAVDKDGKLVQGYYDAVPKTTASLLSIHSTYHINRKNLQDSTVQKFESFKEKKPEYYWTVIRGLVAEGMKGRIYSGWKSITNDQFNEIDARSIFGQDFGSSSPAALVECKIVGSRLYVRQLSYVGLTEKEIGILYCRLGLTDKHIIIADSAEPLTIGKLRRGWQRSDITAEDAERYPGLLKGFNIYAAIKGPGSVATGIDRVKDYEVFVVEDSGDLWNEYREYKWALDKNKNPTDEPEDANNHAMDAIRYVCTGKGRYF